MRLKDLWALTRLVKTKKQISSDYLQTGAYYSIHSRTIVFAIEGSNIEFSEGWWKTVWDWFMNIFYLSKGGRHGLWLAKALWLRPRILETLNKTVGDWDQITITGFSQGGAVAAILTDLFLRNKTFTPGRLQAIIFGSPRPFRWWYPVHFVGAHYVNGADIVTRVPTYLQMYKHAARPVQLKKRGIFLWPRVKHHLPGEYYESIRRLEI